MDSTNPLDDLARSLQERRISRRQFVARGLALGATSTSLAAIIAACSQPAGSTSARPSADAASSTAGAAASPSQTTLKGEIQVLVGFGTGNAPDQIPVQETLAAAFTAIHPDVKVSFLRVPQDARTKLTTLVAGGSPPDVVLPAGLYGISLFLDQDMWLDLGPLFARDGVSVDDFSTETLAATRVPNYYGPNSKAVIGVPVGVHDHALAYNEDLFAKAGVQAPPKEWGTADWTMEKLIETASALTLDKAGKLPGDAGFDADNIVQFGLGHFFRETIWLASGGHHYDATSRKAVYDSPGSIAGIQLAADVVNKHHVTPTSAQVASVGAGGPQGQEEQFAWENGKFAMIDMCSCDSHGFGAANKFKWAVGAMPKGSERVFSFLNLDVGAVVKSSKNSDLAWELLKFLAIDPANELKLALDSYGAIPPLKANSAAFGERLTGLSDADPGVWMDGLSHASPENEAWFPAFAQVNDLVGKHFDKVMGGGSATDEMKALTTEAQAKIDEWFGSHTLPS